VNLPAETSIAPLPTINLAAREAYIRRYSNNFGVGVLAGIDLVVYEHSNVTHDVLYEILEAYGAMLTSLGRTDTFVTIDTEAVRQEDIA